nr:paramyosin isoform X2 [Crassostrea gigas]
MRVVCILVVFLSFKFLSFSNAEFISSSLTDGENKSSTSLETKDQESNELSILRQMINQETVIRLALVKNVHALVNDVTLMKKSLAASEARVTGQQQTIDALKIQVNSLQQENNELKNSSRINEARIMELETKLQTVNENYGTLYDELNVIQKDSDDKRREMFNKTLSVLDDIKIEVRYLSVTLLDFKEHTEIENESRDKKYEELERYNFNSSYEDLRVELFQNKNDSTNRKMLIQNLEDSQTEMRRNFTEKLNRTVAKFETQLKTLEYEQLKLSSAVASLEVANMNLSKQNCDNSNHHAFTAGISSRNSAWTGGTLVFPDVIYSEGTGYNPSTGIFTALTAGTYVFYVSVQSENKQEIRLDIVLNGSSKVRAMAWSSGSSSSIHQTGTNMVILHLQTGDSVLVRRYLGTGYYSDSAHVLTFSGFKLY